MDSFLFSAYRQNRHNQPSSAFTLRLTVLDDGESDLNLSPMKPVYHNDSTASNPAIKGTSHFTLFPLLPIELRLKIWTHALFPRTIIAAVVETPSSEPDTETWEAMVTRRRLQRQRKLHSHSHTNPNSPPPSSPQEPSENPRPHRQIPPLLHICRESRELALKSHTLTFAWKAPHALSPAPSPPQPHESARTPPAQALKTLSHLPASEASKAHPPRTWFSPAHDTLFLVGDLEPYSPAEGLCQPAAYFFLRAQASTVQRVDIAFSSLGIERLEAEDVATVIFHVVDRFCGTEGGRLGVVVEEGDEEVLRPARDGRVRGVRFGGREEGKGKGPRKNVVMGIWEGCMGGRMGGGGKGGGGTELKIEMVGDGEGVDEHGEQ